MADHQLMPEDRSADVGAAAAYAAAERRREILSNAKLAWLVAFDEFKLQEASYPSLTAREGALHGGRANLS